jgi:type IV secretory pathway VirB10-like protein
MQTSATKRRLLWSVVSDHWPRSAGRWPLAAVCVALLASGCIRTAAKTTPDGPPLDVPAAPTRDVEPNDAETPSPVPLMTEPARTAPVRPRPATPREQPARPEPPKPEPPKIEPPPVEPPKPTEEAPKPPSNLQTAPTQAEVEVERGIRASLARANAELSRIDYRVLNADARTQYDTAKRFIRQADDALKSKNLVFAKNLADKAAALAAQLGGR